MARMRQRAAFEAAGRGIGTSFPRGEEECRGVQLDPCLGRVGFPASDPARLCLFLVRIGWPFRELGLIRGLPALEISRSFVLAIDRTSKKESCIEATGELLHVGDVHSRG